MMKFLFLTLLAFIHEIAIGQKSHILTIYVEDNVTHENIKGAQVTLEGFDIKPIKAKYNEAGHFYYFDKKPDNYTTIMVRHKKYNEKGFQELGDFPEKISFKLYTPFRKKSTDEQPYDYKEDPTRLVIFMNDTLYDNNTVVQCPGIKDNQQCFVKSYFEEHYPELETFCGFSTSPLIDDFVFYVMRKDRKAFGRFNDRLIQKMQDDDNILMLFGMLLQTTFTDSKGKSKTFFSKTGEPQFIPEHIIYPSDFTALSTLVGLPKQKPDPGESGLYLTYKEKYAKGMLDDHTYTYTLRKKELQSFYDAYRKREAVGGLYDFERCDRSDTMYHHCGSYYEVKGFFPYNQDFISGGQLVSYPYTIVSDVMAASYFNIDFRTAKLTIDYEYDPTTIHKYNGATPKEHYRSYDEIVKQVNKKNKTIYRLNIHASPFGVMDMLEYYQAEKKINICQNTECLWSWKEQ